MDTFINNLKENADVLEDAELTPQTNLSQLPDWDSIALLSTMAMIASEYGVTLKASEINGAKDIAELFALVQSKQ